MFNITKVLQKKLVPFTMVLGCVTLLAWVAIHLVFAVQPGTGTSIIIIAASLVLASLAFSLYLVSLFARQMTIFKNIVNALTDVVLIKDYQGNFVFCNEAIASFYNTTPDAMMGQNDHAYMKNKEQADVFLENSRAVMDSRTVQEVHEFLTNSQTGEGMHLQSIKVPFVDLDHEPKLLVLAKNITDIVKLREEAERNQKRLQQVLDVSQEGLWEWNRQTNAVLHNQQWERITGIKCSDNTFQEFEECILPEDRPLVHEALGLLIEHNQPYDIEFRMRRPDGEIIWIWDRGKVAEYDDDGHPLWLVGLVQDITQEKHNQQKVASLAYYDQLTGLVNRTQFEHELQKTVERNRRENLSSALCFLDLDRFKRLNDSHGHLIGDTLLQAVANRLSSCVGPHDIIARFGGDEFVVLLNRLGEPRDAAVHAKAEDMARHILKSFEKPFQLGHHEHSCSASIGLTVFSSGSHNYDDLIKQADMAMYDAKGAGRNVVRLFQPKMQTSAQDNASLEADLRRDVTAQNLDLHFQPLVNHLGRIKGAEILLRWSHEQKGMISPAQFIPIAETAGLILPIGDWIFQSACKQLARWAADPVMSGLSLSVNVSAIQLRDDGFVDSVLRTIEETGAPANRLKLEITESMLVSNMDEAIEKMTCLRKHGVRFALDDFGTGYSSLSYLKELPLDQLKIDRSFVRDILVDPNDEAIAEMIVGLGKTLGLSVVAEGVETEEQRLLLEYLGCRSYQGYLFARPMPMKQFDPYARRFLGQRPISGDCSIAL